MDQREYLAKAQEAEALADAAQNPVARITWDNLARKYRWLAQAAVKPRQDQNEPG